MKNKLLILIFISIFCQSCLYEDLGTYNYKDINEVTVKGIVTDRYIDKLSLGDNYDLYPELEFSKDGDESNYEYRWIAMPRNPIGNEPKLYELGTEKNLTGPVKLMAGQYICYYYVTDKKTGIVWSTKFYLAVSSTTDAGWCVLCDENGKTRIDMVAPRVVNKEIKEYIISQDIVGESNLLGKPKHLFAQSAHSNNLNIFHVVGENGTFRILNKRFVISEATDLKMEFGIIPPKIIANEIQQTHTHSDDARLRVVVDEEGNYYTQHYTSAGSVYGYRQNVNPTYTIDNGEEQYFVTAPWVGVRMVRMANSMLTGEMGPGEGENHNVILFDQTNKRFMSIQKGKTKSQVMIFANDGTLWKGAKIDKRMIIGQNIVMPGNGKRQMLCGLFTDETDVWFYGVASIQNDGYNKQMYYKKLSAPHDILNAKSVAFSSNFERIYYTKGPTVCMIDYSDAVGDLTPIEILNFPNEEVVKLGFWSQMSSQVISNFPWYASQHWLTIATNKTGVTENPGVLRSYEVPLLLNGSYKKKFEADKLGNIIDFAFKEIMGTSGEFF